MSRSPHHHQQMHHRAHSNGGYHQPQSSADQHYAGASPSGYASPPSHGTGFTTAVYDGGHQSSRKPYFNYNHGVGVNGNMVEDGKANLYIANLPLTITDTELRLLFQPYGNNTLLFAALGMVPIVTDGYYCTGPILRVKVPVDKNTGVSAGMYSKPYHIYDI